MSHVRSIAYLRSAKSRGASPARVACSIGLLLGLSLAAPIGHAPALAASEEVLPAAQYVQTIINGMVDVSRKPTRERRAFYEDMLMNQIDWNAPAMHALGSRWAALDPADRRKLAEWSRNALLGEDSVMEFIQNLIFTYCLITGRSPESEGANVRISCGRFGNEPNFSVRLLVQRRGERYQIVDVGYVGISLIEALGEALTDPDAVAKHGVRVGRSRSDVGGASRQPVPAG